MDSKYIIDNVIVYDEASPYSDVEFEQLLISAGKGFIKWKP